MASRSEEKERRRRERQAAEEAAARTAGRRRVLRIGGIAAVAVVVAVIIAVVVAGGGSDGDAEALAAEATAAGCTVREYPSEGREHSDQKATYKTNPPTSGTHNPTPAPDGIYAPGNEPAPENWVHTLEHGRIIFQYKPGTSQADIQKLRALVSEEFKGSAGYHQVLLQNNTKMPANFAAVAWTRAMTCRSLTPQVLDAMRGFRDAYVDKAPELIP